MNDKYRDEQRRRISTSDGSERTNLLWLAAILIALIALVNGGSAFLDWLDEPFLKQQDTGSSMDANLDGRHEPASALSSEDLRASTTSVATGNAIATGSSSARLHVPGNGKTGFSNAGSLESSARKLDNSASNLPMRRLGVEAFETTSTSSDSGFDSDSDASFDPDSDELPDDEPPEQFSISGWVMNQDGEPVPGIQLKLMVHRLFEESSETTYVSRQLIQITRSDDMGYFIFTALADGEYTIRSQATDVYSAARILVRAGVDSADLMLQEYTDEIRVYGLVENTDGEPLEKVHVIPIRQKDRATVTDGEGNYTLAVTAGGSRQATTLRFLLDGYKEQRRTFAAKDLLEQESIRLDAVLEPSAGFVRISGTVSDDDGSPVYKASVVLSSVDLKRNYHTFSDETGFFVFSEVEVGEDYQLRIQQSDLYREYTEQSLKLTSNRSDLHIVLEFLGNGSIEGRMVNLEGNPIPRFSLWLRSLDAPNRPRLLVTGDGSGIFSLNDVPAGGLKLESHVSPYLSIEGIELPPGGHLNIQPVIDWGNHELYGTVVDIQGNPIPQARLSLSWRHDYDGLRSRSSRWANSGADGYFLFTRLGSGLHQLHITASGFESVQFDHEIGVDKDETQVTLDVEN